MCADPAACVPCREAGITGHLVVATDLFKVATSQRMALHLSNLLTAVASQPEAQLSSVSLMAPEEQHTVLHTFNRTAGPAPTLCAHQHFERQAAALPHTACLIDSATGSSLTYAEVNQAANRLARRLVSAGIGADDPVAVLMDKCFEAYIALIAVLKAGGEQICGLRLQIIILMNRQAVLQKTLGVCHLGWDGSPPHTQELCLCAGCYQPLDHTLPAGRIAEVLQQSGARVLLVSPALAGIRDSLPAVEALIAEPAWRQFSDLNPSNLAMRSGVDNAMYLMFTSGACRVATPNAAVLCGRTCAHYVSQAEPPFDWLNVVLLQGRLASRRASVCNTVAWPM
jgi:non-ribosomal peptide synthetase component F